MCIYNQRVCVCVQYFRLTQCSGSFHQVDQELATGEFFLRDSVKKRKKMVEIKVSANPSLPASVLYFLK